MKLSVQMFSYFTQFSLLFLLWLVNIKKYIAQVEWKNFPERCTLKYFIEINK